MKFSTITAYGALALPLVRALPAAVSTASVVGNTSVVELPGNVVGSSTQSLPNAPTTLRVEEKSYLDRYQPLSDAASNAIGAKDNNTFSSAGQCFRQYPCLSVVRAGVVKMASGAPINTTQMAAVLDQITAQPTITLGQDNHDTVINGYKLTSHGVVTEVFAPRGTVDSRVLAGMFHDMYKLQADRSDVDSIRAVQASTDGQQPPAVALCLYPEAADATAALNFCMGKELDGTSMPARASSRAVKRFSLDGALTALCHIIDIPLLCP